MTRILRPSILIPLAIVMIVATCLMVGHQNGKDSGKLRVSGTIEADDTSISSVLPGRIVACKLNEGASVRKGDTIVELDGSAYRSTLSNINVSISAIDRQRHQLQSSVGRLEQSLGSARQMANQKELVMSRLMQPTDDQTTNARASRRASMKEKRLAKLLQAYAARSESAAKQSAAMNASSLMNLQIAELKAKSGALELERFKLQQSRDEAGSKLNQMVIRAPINGVCSSKNVQIGEVALPGQAIANVYDPANMFLHAFASAKDIGKIKMGQRANVYLDSTRKHALPAKVVQIDQKAYFTPENIATPQGRSTEVFGLKLKLLKPDGSAKPGMPADAEFLAANGTAQ